MIIRMALPSAGILDPFRVREIRKRKALKGLNPSAQGNALLLHGKHRKLKNLSKK
jgi:hypothetical protein